METVHDAAGGGLGLRRCFIPLPLHVPGRRRGSRPCDGSVQCQGCHCTTISPQLLLAMKSARRLRSQTKTSSNNIMNCFQHTPEPCGALINPRGEHHTKKASPQTTPSKASTHAYSFKRLAPLRLPLTSPFSPDLMRLTRARTHLTPQHWLLCHLG